MSTNLYFARSLAASAKALEPLLRASVSGPGKRPAANISCMRRACSFSAAANAAGAICAAADPGATTAPGHCALPVPSPVPGAPSPDIHIDPGTCPTPLPPVSFVEGAGAAAVLAALDAEALAAPDPALEPTFTPASTLDAPLLRRGRCRTLGLSRTITLVSTSVMQHSAASEPLSSDTASIVNPQSMPERARMDVV